MSWRTSPSSARWPRTRRCPACWPGSAVSGCRSLPSAARTASQVAAVWQDSRRNVFLPFDPAEIMQQFWSESYLRADRPALATAGRAAALRGYYLARPALPRPVQLRLRRAFTGCRAGIGLPALAAGAEPARLLRMAVRADRRADRDAGAVPGRLAGPAVLGHGPHPRRRDGGCQRQIELLRGLERERGYTRSWNFVGERYDVDPGLVRELQEEGCEVGVHGLRHDGRDLGSRRLMERRRPAMRQYAQQWGAVGFRSPGTQRHWDLMPRLGFEYDSSYSDTDPYEPQPGGCCTYLPYFNRDMVELPITMPQDHTLFAILQQPDGGPGRARPGCCASAAGWHWCSRTRTTPATGGQGRIPRGARRALRRPHRLARAAARGRGLVAQPGRVDDPR